ncbi:hypothetical protein E4K72_01635 [Oxalobacteraceae bacterium OM1]|nr:hypothetical protein E4K72_01635 [Oxalobacteraceae bacterium OM1]
MGMTKSVIEEASAKLAEEFQRAVPLDPRMKYGKKPSDSEIQSRIESDLKKFYDVAGQERQRLGLGIIGRAKLAFSLQQKLLAKGYAAPIVKQVLMALLASVLVGGNK